MAWREFSLYTICFAAMFSISFKNSLRLRLFRSALENTQNFVLAHDQVLIPVDLDVRSGIFAEQDAIARLYVQRLTRPGLLVNLSAADGDDFAFLRFFLCGIGDEQPTGRLLRAILDPFDHNSVV